MAGSGCPVAGGAVSRLALLIVLAALVGGAGCEQPRQGTNAPAEAPRARADRERAVGGREDEKGKPLEWQRPRFVERRDERERLVRRYIAPPASRVRDQRVVEAMRQVPRHLFMPIDGRDLAYTDSARSIDYGQTISQPSLVAYMTDLLELEPGDRVLEIGTGSGYQAAVLSELTPEVYTIEIIKPLGEQASERLKKLGYETVEVKIGDGYFGWQEHAPFDGVIVTCAAGHVPPPLIKQLKPGGRMVIPVGDPFTVQYLIRVRKGEKGEISSEQLMAVQFVPMTGRAEEPP